jgi:riboflavin kinase/FMN adenylyltransferase
MSFDTHPASMVSGKQIPMINSVEDRCWLIRTCYGIDEVILAHFDEKMMHQPWRDFITDYLIGELGAAYVVCGSDFRFGDRGEGTAQRLQETCAALGVGCQVVGMVSVEGTQVHSTLIRTLLEQGRIEEANRFLGHPHILTHTVEAGKHLGSALGFPTVNLAFQPGVLVPAYGVYATKLYLGEEDTQGHIAVTNIGVRPTVEQTDRVTVEGFILDFSGDLYGKTLRMEFYHYLRGERRFESLQALTEEVMRNAEQTRQYFAAR